MKHGGWFGRGIGPALLAVVAGALGGALGVAGTARSDGALVTQADRSALIQVISFDGSFDTVGRVVRAPTTPILSAIGGRVDRSACEVGARLAEGDVIASINGHPQVGLMTTGVVYRDLDDASTGPDVSEAIDALRRLGVTGERAVAFDRFNVRYGISAPEGTLLAATVVRVDSSVSTIRSCPATIGAPIGVGEPLATTTTGNDAIEIEAPLPALLRGVQLLVRVGEVEVPVDPLPGDGPTRIEQPELVAAGRVSSGGSGPSSQVVPDPTDTNPAVPVTIRLRTPVEVWSVPLAALRRSSTGCSLTVAEPRHRVLPIETVAVAGDQIYVRPAAGVDATSVEVTTGGSAGCP